MHLRVLLAGLAVILLCQSVSAQKWGKITDDEWAIQAPADYPEANAVIIFSRATLRVTPDVIEIEYHYRMKVLNSAHLLYSS